MKRSVARTPTRMSEDVLGQFDRWLSVDQIRKMQRMRRATVRGRDGAGRTTV
jgi:hypothetical protein